MNRQGSSNRLIYDSCAYNRSIKESTSPGEYRLYGGANENCGKCIFENFYMPFDKEIVDVESELLNITRPNTKCTELKYDPRCKKSNLCTSTYDKNRPIVFAPEVCPILYQNIPRQTSNGFSNLSFMNTKK
jgi:hypothetical protein